MIYADKVICDIECSIVIGPFNIAYGDWIWYSKDYSLSKPEERLPNGDCLELICDNGCVEDDSNNYFGGCCPTDGTCRVENQDVDACCGNGLSCKDGKCVESCPEVLPTYHEPCTEECGCLNPAETGLVCSTTTNKCICPQKDQMWDKEQGKCADLCEIKDTVPLYKEWYSQKGRSEQVTIAGCCPKDQLVALSTKGTGHGYGYVEVHQDLVGTFNGYKLGEKEIKYGCCPSNRIYTKKLSYGDGEVKACCDVGEVPTKDVELGVMRCCPKDSVFERNGEKYCCAAFCSEDSYSKGYVYDAGKKCCKGNWKDGKCLCDNGSCWDNNGCKKCVRKDNEVKYVLDSSMDGKKCGSCRYCRSGTCSGLGLGVYRGRRGNEDLCCDCPVCQNAVCQWCPDGQPQSACSPSFQYFESDWNTISS